ncbi:glycoprotein IX (platelet) [Conger conger]|uniref:glycoprotein IX (platelet) n=1 Tax=Conger conger TaxID=82655 RepID=UPI002A59D499|nr:glycoprotein IX (platelet) [Conger conger]
MLSGPALVLLLLASCSGQEGLRVSCGSQNLAELPLLPPETTDLYLQDNRLTSVPPGSFDTLQGLRTLNLTGNPFHCGCSIRYLSAWLRDHAEVTVKVPTCASPASLAGRPIASLGQAHFSACGRKSGVFDGVILLSLAFLVLLLLWCLKTAKSSTFILEVFGRHAGFEAHTLRSRKPRHRRKRHAAQSDETEVMLERMDDDNLDAPLLNMEILPQILDVLQKKHNIKFKAP